MATVMLAPGEFAIEQAGVDWWHLRGAVALLLADILSAEEAEDLIFQIGRSKGRGGRRHRPYAFTEQGIGMLSSILNSDRAIRVNIAIM